VLVAEHVAGTPRAVALRRVATLDHVRRGLAEARDDAVEDRAVVELVVREEDEVVYRLRRLFGEELDLDDAQRRRQRRRVALGVVDGEARGRRELLLADGRIPGFGAGR